MAEEEDSEEVEEVEEEVSDLEEALQGHPGEHLQAIEHLATKVIGTEFTSIIRTVPLT